MNTQNKEANTMKNTLQQLKEYGQTVCAKVLLLPNGAMVKAADVDFITALAAVYVYDFINNKIYKI